MVISTFQTLIPLKISSRYSFDTSAFIEMGQLYPKDVFPTIWSKMESFMKNKIVLATDLVKDELELQHDDLFDFIKKNNPFVTPNKQEQQAVAILIQMPDFLDWAKSGLYNADPFVVALGSIHNLIVVTQEKTTSPKKIPAACKALGVSCINFLEFLRKENIKL